MAPEQRPPSDVKAGNGTRTRDPNLGKVVLYQLSYSRSTAHATKPHRDGDERDRTADLLNAIQALSQLSYAPGARHPRQQEAPLARDSANEGVRNCAV